MSSCFLFQFYVKHLELPIEIEKPQKQTVNVT